MDCINNDWRRKRAKKIAVRFIDEYNLSVDENQSRLSVQGSSVNGVRPACDNSTWVQLPVSGSVENN